MSTSSRLALLLGISLLTTLTGCHGRFLIPPPPGYAYGANPATGGAYGQYGDCVHSGGAYAGYDPQGYGAYRHPGHQVRERLQARRDARQAHHHGRRPGRPRGHQGAHGDIACDTYFDGGCDECGACDCCDNCSSCCEYDSCGCDSCGGCDSCHTCSPCGNCNPCGGVNPGPYIAYLIPMSSYGGEFCEDGMCIDGMSGCPCEIEGGGSCSGGSCQTFSNDDPNWQTVPGQLHTPSPTPQPTNSIDQESLPTPPAEEGDFQSRPDSENESQTGYSAPQNIQWIPNQL